MEKEEKEKKGRERKREERNAHERRKRARFRSCRETRKAEKSREHKRCINASRRRSEEDKTGGVKARKVGGEGKREKKEKEKYIRTSRSVYSRSDNNGGDALAVPQARREL